MSAGILQKMKEGAENVEKKIQAKVESLKNPETGKGSKNLFSFSKIRLTNFCLQTVQMY